MIGVLALQGDFSDHLLSLEKHGVEGMEVRTKVDLSKVDALIFPGGESTTISQLMNSSGLDKAIISRSKEGMPLWGTCAGAILLAKKVYKKGALETHLGLLDIEIERNSYGRQTESFSATIEIDGNGTEVLFIRAPRILKTGRWVKTLASYKKDPVMVRTKKILATCFHSELRYPDPILIYFLLMCGMKKIR